MTITKSGRFEIRHNALAVFARQLLHIERELRALREDSDRLRHDINELWNKMKKLEGVNGNGINIA